MKKNTGFIKRLRTGITPTSQVTFLQEVRALSLHKYLSELISACYEGLCRLKTPGEIAVGVEIVSALHQRFGPEDFTVYLGWYIGRGLSSPDRSALKALSADIREREERERLSRQRIMLRVATELWLVGVLKSLDDVARPAEAGQAKDLTVTGDGARSKSATATDSVDAEPFPLEALKDLLGHDREHVNLVLVVVFVRTFGWDILGTKVERLSEPVATGHETPLSGGRQATLGGSDQEDDPPLVDEALRQRFRNILVRYFEQVKTHVERDQNQLIAQRKRNAEAYVKSGEVFEDRQANFEKQTKAQDKLVANAQVLAAALELDMPDLSDKDASGFGGDGGIELVKTGEYLRASSDGAGIWEDEEERRFYEGILDLRERVPGILLEDPKKKKGDAAEDETKPSEKSTSTTVATPTAPVEGDEASTAIANRTVGAQVDALLARLPELVTRDQTDQFAIDFCFVNSKASRNRFIRAVQDVPKGRFDLLPLYSRVIAILSRCFPDITQAMVAHLDDEFRSLQRRKTKEFLGTVRMINVRYIAELAKFAIVPEHVMFHCLKVCLDDFSRTNIEIIANLLESCGRYLLRNPDTSPRMASFLDILQKKKSAQHLDQQGRMLLENAMYHVNPPERAAIQQKERDPLDLYVRKLIYLDLTKKNVEKMVKQLRKLHWEEPEVPEILRKIFTKPGKIKFSNVHLLAVMLGSLYRYHADFAISVLDELLEKITVGLEANDFKQNQKRIAEVKYLGELYAYRMVDSTLVFDVLFKLLNYGHQGGHARPGDLCPIDLPDDYFRIRLVAALLETCGQFFDKGSLKKKLDFFLTFLQYYINVKEPMPMDVEFVVQDIYAMLRPKWEIETTLEVASQKFAEACKQNYQSLASAKEVEPDEPEAEVSSDDERDGADRTRSGSESEDEVDAEEDTTTPPAQANEEDDVEVMTRRNDYRDPEADAEFARELAKLMAESVDSRRSDRKQVFDVPLPIRRQQISQPSGPAWLQQREMPGPDGDAQISDRNGEAEAAATTPATDAGPGVMKFALLSRRGNKQQTRSIDLPADSHFAVAMRTQQEVERAEQQRIKNLVLNYDLTAGDDSGHDALEAVYHQPRIDKSGSSRGTQRARKLQLSDVDWT